MGRLAIFSSRVLKVGNRQPPIFLPTALCWLPTDQYLKQLILYTIRHLRLNLTLVLFIFYMAPINYFTICREL